MEARCREDLRHDGLNTRFPNLSEYEIATIHGEDIKVIILRCELQTSHGFIAAEGTGARRVDQDHGDINKSLKMAQKSAHIDATLRVAGLSEIFTQDIEDFISDKTQPHAPSPKQPEPAKPGNHEVCQAVSPHPLCSSPPPPVLSPEKPPQRYSAADDRITERQYAFLMFLIQKGGMSKEKLDSHCRETYHALPEIFPSEKPVS